MSSNPSSMNPTESLQAAMACLDLALESELALYRRQHLQISGALALQESDGMGESSGPFETDAGETSHTHSSAISSLQNLSSQVENPLDSSLTTLPDQMGSPQEINVSEARTDSVYDVAPAKREIMFTAGSEEDPETLPEPYSAEAVTKPEALERFLDPSIEDYLESSEALLKHLDEGTIAKPAKPSRPKTPQKSSSQTSSALAFKLLGGVLAIALLIGIAMSILKLLTAKPRKTPASQSSVQTTPVPVVASPSAIAITPLNLKPTPTQAATASASSSPSSSPSVRPSAFYAVVAPYQGNASLQRARQLVPDAFIADINGQRRIQLAFLDDLQRAQRLVNDLKNEGFPATIVPQK